MLFVICELVNKILFGLHAFVQLKWKLALIYVRIILNPPLKWKNTNHIQHGLRYLSTSLSRHLIPTNTFSSLRYCDTWFLSGELATTNFLIIVWQPKSVWFYWLFFKSLTLYALWTYCAASVALQLRSVRLFSVSELQMALWRRYTKLKVSANFRLNFRVRYRNKNLTYNYDNSFASHRIEFAWTLSYVNCATLPMNNADSRRHLPTRLTYLLIK